MRRERGRYEEVKEEKTMDGRVGRREGWKEIDEEGKNGGKEVGNVGF